jgi:hypothetical protein
MKSILFFPLTFLLACSTPTVDISRPEGVPSSMRWGTYEHYAYQQGRMYFNKDSSIMLIVPERPEYNETSTSLISPSVSINTNISK